MNDRDLYPESWEAISARIRFGRAGGRCEQCGIPHGTFGYRDQQGHFHSLVQVFAAMLQGINPFEGDLAGVEPGKPTQIFLQCAHKDGNKSNCTDENLISVCPKCHFDMDRPGQPPARSYGRRYRLHQYDLFHSPSDEAR
ncbi:hypothetical protein SAMN05421823_102543 [Catalinimonas alkaloidigena]|uniref:Uncharacterized protein n=1 Tax=Catalinimonas alkaloidigena TaxID=1075417 RepID=A0A1G9B9H3_9BACT|nr:hypothetical protein [Catalinimonas alkaloidigena]SDK35670.1 hypothetical protein SAMN05421823_102543 [Catalinimonas alkaloidigena]